MPRGNGFLSVWTFELGDVTAAPGETSVLLPFSIQVEPGGPLVKGFEAAISYDSSVLTAVSIEEARQATLFNRDHPVNLPAMDGLRAVTGVYGRIKGLTPDRSSDLISPSSDGLVANLEFCVSEAARPGTYPVEFKLAVPYRWNDFTTAHIHGGGGGYHHSFFNAYGPEAECMEVPWLCMYFPITVSGSVTVQGDPVIGEACIPWPPVDPVTLSLGQATAAPGQTDVSLPLSISVSRRAMHPVTGWMAIVRYDPEVLGEVTLESTRPADFWHFSGPSRFGRDPGTIGLTIDYYFREPPRGEPITHLNDGVIGELRFCVHRNAVPGTYPVKLVEEATMFILPGGDEGAWLQTVYRFDGAAWPAARQDGAVTIAGDPVEGACKRDLEDLARFKATFELGADLAVPGGEAVVPFTINPGAPGEGFSFSVDFDEEILQATAIEKTFKLPDGTTDYDFEILRHDNRNLSPGNRGIDEGFLVGAVIYSNSLPRVALPPEEDSRVLAFHFQVDPGARPGTSTVLRFLDGAVPPGGEVPVENVLSIGGRSVLPGLEAAYVYLPGQVAIVGDVSVFVRGDSNGDGRVNISDPQNTLSYLFLGGSRPGCPDAADANDDGRVNVTDPIFMLQRMFLGGEALPPPADSCGEDPTADSLAGCLAGC